MCPFGAAPEFFQGDAQRVKVRSGGFFQWTPQRTHGKASADFLIRVSMVVLLGRNRQPRGGVMDHDSVYRRGGCRDETAGKLLGARCPGPELAGAWVVVLHHRPAIDGGRAAASAARRLRDQGGSCRGAGCARVPGRRARAGAIDGGMAEPVAGVARVAACIHRSQLRGEHTGILIPYLGGIPLAALRPGTRRPCSPQSSATRPRWGGR
jgi:hypothetical protein